MFEDMVRKVIFIYSANFQSHAEIPSKRLVCKEKIRKICDRHKSKQDRNIIVIRVEFILP